MSRCSYPELGSRIDLSEAPNESDVTYRQSPPLLGRQLPAGQAHVPCDGRCRTALGREYQAQPEHSAAGAPREVGCLLPVRPDAELLTLCREVTGADRIAEGVRGGSGPCAWTDKPEHQRAISALGEACRTQDRLLPRVIKVRPITTADVVAKAQAIELLFATSHGKRAEAVRALVADLVAVLEAGADPNGVPS